MTARASRRRPRQDVRMKIATYNVSSIGALLPILLECLAS